MGFTSISLPGEGEIVKQGDAVGLRPYPDFTSVLECLVIPLKRGLAVESDFEVIALKINAQRVPLAARDLDLHALLFCALALDRVIDAEVIFESVGAGDVVIVSILRAPDNAAGLVFLACDGLELHFDKTVFEAGV